MIDEKIKIEKNNKKTLDEKEILLNNSSKIRGLVNYNKLNYILTENSLNISNSKSGKEVFFFAPLIIESL